MKKASTAASSQVTAVNGDSRRRPRRPGAGGGAGAVGRSSRASLIVDHDHAVLGRDADPHEVALREVAGAVAVVVPHPHDGPADVDEELGVHAEVGGADHASLPGVV